MTLKTEHIALIATIVGCVLLLLGYFGLYGVPLNSWRIMGEPPETVLSIYGPPDFTEDDREFVGPAGDVSWYYHSGLLGTSVVTFQNDRVAGVSDRGGR